MGATQKEGSEDPPTKFALRDGFPVEYVEPRQFVADEGRGDRAGKAVPNAGRVGRNTVEESVQGGGDSLDQGFASGVAETLQVHELLPAGGDDAPQRSATNQALDVRTLQACGFGRWNVFFPVFFRVGEWVDLVYPTDTLNRQRAVRTRSGGGRPLAPG